MHGDKGLVENPQFLTLSEVGEALSHCGKLVIQFSRPDAYSPDLLRRLNEICGQLPGTLKVRFYGHYGTIFDAAILRHLPAVKNLSLDCLSDIENEDAIANLSQLRSLTFGVFEYSRPDILNRLDLSALTALSLLENRKRDFDLAPLATATALTELNLQGHCKGFATLANLAALESLHLGSIASKQSLEMIGNVPSLKRLTLQLGGRERFDELSSNTLETLQILRVKGLTTLGDLSRFPVLRGLQVEDQVQLNFLDLEGTKLHRLHLFNCKTLGQLAGLDDQDQLKWVFISKTALKMDALRDRDWPESLRKIRLLSSGQKWNEATAAAFAKRGVMEQVCWWQRTEQT
jgi:hypothetical protein